MRDGRAHQPRESTRDGARELPRDVSRRTVGMRLTTPVPASRGAARARRTEPPRGRSSGVRAALVLTLVAGASAAAVVGVGELLSKAEALPMRTLAVRGAEGALADEVRAYAGLESGVPLFSVSLDDVAARVLEHPYVRSAEVRRVPPDAIEIRVERRSAAALVQAGALYLVDELGAVFKGARAGDGLDLPLITGLSDADVQSGAAQADLDRALALLRAHATAGAPGGEVSEVHIAGDGALSLVLGSGALGSGARIHIGDAEGASSFEDKLARLTVIVSRLESAGQQASSIRLDDERRPERAAVRLRAGAETRPSGG